MPNTYLDYLRAALNNPALSEAEIKDLIMCHIDFNALIYFSFGDYFSDKLYARRLMPLRTLEQNPSYSEWKLIEFDELKGFQGLLYRGTSKEKPEIVFSRGIEPKDYSDNYLDYIRQNNGSIGVSTSKSKWLLLIMAKEGLKPMQNIIFMKLIIEVLW